ncbi:hypothetical protein LSH36_255g06026 [Paralvinella palmiformis]|uniref:C-type lectin domain-containing protein n=1 Tax=Paralvinella palmiformis TaxID=53620 RepID=A0AAD9JKI0_9ANNE|nr:hypothetical protein LSH36_255g06026 [Paralvinella palmiformis]
MGGLRWCRQDLECFAFGVQWTEQGFGICNIYVPCPLNFDWDIYVKKCYSLEIFGPSRWSNAVDQCRSTHPGAKLIEPRNALENQRLAVMAGATDVWIGLYRPSISTDLNDIRYSSDGQLIGYTQWGGGQPNNNNGQESVVMALSSANYKWFDKTRTEIGKFICEI